MLGIVSGSNLAVISSSEMGFESFKGVVTKWRAPQVEWLTFQMPSMLAGTSMSGSLALMASASSLTVALRGTLTRERTSTRPRIM